MVLEFYHSGMGQGAWKQQAQNTPQTANARGGIQREPGQLILKVDV
jgi:hypothetical protein